MQMSSENRKLLKEVGSKLGLVLSESQIDTLFCYMDLVLVENEKYNLTADTDRDRFVVRHLADSLTAAPHIPPSCRLLDLGSGAGLPGIPLKICLPELEVDLLEARKNRFRFLTKAVYQLGLNGLNTVRDRAETCAHSAEYRGQFDCVVARAVADLRVLAELALPFLKINGRLLAYKGSEPQAEVDASRMSISTLGGTLEEIYYPDLSLPNSHLLGTIISIRLERFPPEHYPRRPGIPEKRPIG